MVKVNLLGQELRTFEPIPPGEYRVAVEQAEERTSEAGQPNIFWLFKVTDVHKVRTTRDTDYIEPEGLIGRTVMHGTSLQEKALWNLYRTLIALGTEPEELEDDEYEVMPEDYLGKECVITVSLRDFRGEPQNRILNLRALNEQELARLA